MGGESDEAASLSPRRAELPPTPARELGSCAALLLAIFLAHSSGLSGGFVWDDQHLIEGHPAIEKYQGLSHYFLEPFWSQSELGDFGRPFYRPIVILSFVADQALWNGEAHGFHWTNLLLHLGVCALLYAGCRRLGAAPSSSALVVAVFGSFPRLTESVAWISGRTDLLATLGVLGALLVYSSERDALLRRSLSALCLLLGLLSKEVALAGACALVALELARLRRGSGAVGGALRNLAPAGAVVVLWSALRGIALAGGPAAASSAEWFSLAQRALIFPLQTLGTYVLMVATPWSASTRIGRIGIAEPGLIGLGVVAALVLLWLAVESLRRPWSPAAAAALALAGSALLPVLNWIEPLQPVVASDRYLYLPLGGTALLLACATKRIPAPARRASALAALALCLGLAAGTHARSRLWTDDVALWHADLERAHPLNPTPRSLLAAALGRRGESQAALALYIEARDIEAAFAERYPSYPEDHLLWGNLGLGLSEVGRYEEAAAELRAAVQAYPEVPLLRLDLAVVLARSLEFAAADAVFEQALALKPDFDEARSARAQARRAAQMLERLPPRSPAESTAVAVRRGTALALVGRLDDAGAIFARVAADPEAATPELRSATVFLVMRGRPAAAELALTALERRADAPSETVAALRSQLAARVALQ